MIPADKNERRRPPAVARRRCAATLLQAAGECGLFCVAGLSRRGQSSKTLMDTLGHAGRTATFPGNVLSLKARPGLHALTAPRSITTSDIDAKHPLSLRARPRFFLSFPSPLRFFLLSLPPTFYSFFSLFAGTRNRSGC